MSVSPNSSFSSLFPASIPAAWFGSVLGLSGLGQSWRVAAHLWSVPSWIGEGILGIATGVWLWLLISYGLQAIRHPAHIKAEFMHPVQGGTPALLGISTLLIALATAPYSMTLTLLLAGLGICWHLFFSLWHTGQIWQRGRDPLQTTPTVYLPTAAGNFVSAAVLGMLNQPTWGLLFLGAGIFSWLAQESLIHQRLAHADALPVTQRPLLGIQFAPPVVCAMASLLLFPPSATPWLLLLWGYGLFQLLLACRLIGWLHEQSFSPAYWSYSFGVTAATVTGLKLAVLQVDCAKILAFPIFGLCNLFIGYLILQSLKLRFRTLQTA